MTQYDELVQYQRNKLEAEEWAKGIKQLHVFDAATTNMWYEEHPEDGRVLEVGSTSSHAVRRFLGRRMLWAS